MTKKKDTAASDIQQDLRAPLLGDEEADAGAIAPAVASGGSNEGIGAASPDNGSEGAVTAAQARTVVDHLSTCCGRTAATAVVAFWRWCFSGVRSMALLFLLSLAVPSVLVVCFSYPGMHHKRNRLGPTQQSTHAFNYYPYRHLPHFMFNWDKTLLVYFQYGIGSIAGIAILVCLGLSVRALWWRWQWKPRPSWWI